MKPLKTPWVRVCSFLLGAWLISTVFMVFVASGNFHIMKPENLRDAAEIYKAIPEAKRAAAIKHGANELNYFFFFYYNWAQFVMGLLVLASAWAANLRSRVFWGLGVASLLIALSSAAYFTPLITELGRQIEFMPRDPMPDEVKRFGMIHGMNFLLEFFKCALLAGATAVVVRAESPAAAG